MTDPVLALVVFAAEGHPPDSFVAQIATPVAILAFFGTTYLLVRSNLGTKLGYLVTATTFFGFMMVFSLFWAFGGFGTPQASGPTQMPGQEVGELEPNWVPFAEDSRLAQQPELEMVADFPDGFEMYESIEEVEQAIADGEEVDLIEDGVEDIRAFFAEETVLDQEFGVIDEIDEPIEIGVGETGDGELLLGVTYVEIDEETFEEADDAYTYTGFGYYDEGAPLLPALVFFGISAVLFALHGWLLDRDERLERRDREQTEELEEAERVPQPA